MGQIPELIISGTIINDGRRLLISNQPVGYLTQPEYTLPTAAPPIDAVDFAAFFARQDPYNLRITSALRMNATFPFILPVAKLPSIPRMNIMDAGLSDNFGTSLISRYLFVLRDWLKENTSEVIFLQIRDTRENDIATNSDQSTLGSMVVDPFVVIQNKWEAIQSYSHEYIKDYAPTFLGGKLRQLTLQYVPKESKKVAALNFHLTQKEKEDLYLSIYTRDNQATIDTLAKLLR
jgi:hypothetical protein